MFAIYFLITFPLIAIFFFLDQSNIPIIFINKEIKLQYLNIELHDFDFREWYVTIFDQEVNSKNRKAVNRIVSYHEQEGL